MSSFSGGDDAPTAAEWAVMAVSVAVTLLLFGYVAWHAGTVPEDATPEVTVTETRQMDDDRLAVAVEVYNRAGTGLDTITVSADCSNQSITLTHVPTDGRRSGTVVCPAGVDDPSAVILSWTEL